MSRECWLRTNSRVASLGFLVPGLLIMAGVLLILLAPGSAGFSVWQAAGVALLAAAALMAVAVVYMLRLPRLAYRDGELLVYLRGFRPEAVPIEKVEVFFLGQTESMMPGKGGVSAKTSAVVVRLAEKATAWHARDVSTALGKWQDGYITIRGTWCEPISPDVLKQLNDRLIAAHRRRQESEKAAAP
ncbi:MAG: hypothetical protein RIC55_13275 [Pirellulaceae bacterium]